MFRPQVFLIRRHGGIAASLESGDLGMIWVLAHRFEAPRGLFKAFPQTHDGSSPEPQPMPWSPRSAGMPSCARAPSPHAMKRRTHYEPIKAAVTRNRRFRENGWVSSAYLEEEDPSCFTKLPPRVREKLWTLTPGQTLCCVQGNLVSLSPFFLSVLLCFSLYSSVHVVKNCNPVPKIFCQVQAD